MLMTRASPAAWPNQKPPEEPGDRRRRQLLDATAALIAEKGLEGLRTRDIAARAGMNISTLHYYFSTKNELLHALMQDAREAFKPPLRSAADQEYAQPWDLRSHLAYSMRAFQANTDLAIVLQEFLLRARRDPDARAAFQALLEEWNGKVETIVRNEIGHGRMRADLDPRTGAAVITSFMMGARLQLDVATKSFDLDAASQELVRWLAVPPHD
jgi:AcrR family transcriptional regulator